MTDKEDPKALEVSTGTGIASWRGRKKIDLEPALEALRTHGQPRMAARAGGVAWDWVYDRIRRDVSDGHGGRMVNPRFDAALHAAWASAHEDFIERIKDEAYKRAVEGYIRRPVYQNGEHVGDDVVKSDTLLLALLKRHDSGFRDRVDLIAQTKDQEEERETREEKTVDLSQLSREGRAALRVVLSELGDGSIPKGLLDSLSSDADVVEVGTESAG